MHYNNISKSSIFTIQYKDLQSTRFIFTIQSLLFSKLIKTSTYLYAFYYNVQTPPVMPMFDRESGTPYSTHQQNSSAAFFHHGHYLIILNVGDRGFLSFGEVTDAWSCTWSTRVCVCTCLVGCCIAPFACVFPSFTASFSCFVHQNRNERPHQRQGGTWIECCTRADRSGARFACLAAVKPSGRGCCCVG